MYDASINSAQTNPIFGNNHNIDSYFLETIEDFIK